MVNLVGFLTFYIYICIYVYIYIHIYIYIYIYGRIEVNMWSTCWW